MLKYCGVLVLAVVLVLSSAGCAGMGNNKVKTNEYPGHSAKRLITENRAQVQTYTSFNKNVSDKITNVVSSVAGVRKAIVIVYGSEAIVGIDVKKGEKPWRVEQKALQAVKNSRPGYSVHVTADKNLYARIESIRKQMVLHPNHNFSGDITILIQDIDLKVTAPTPTPTPTPNHWHKPTPTPAPHHRHMPTPTPTPKPRHG